MSTVDQLEMFKGEDVVFRFTVLDEDDERYSLTAATDIQFEVKTADGGADPALISKNLAAGVVKLNQTVSETKGQFEVTLLAANTSALAIGTLRYDVWLIEGGLRKVVIQPSNFVLRASVNLP